MRSKIIHGVVCQIPVWKIAGDNFVVNNGASQLENAETKLLITLVVKGTVKEFILVGIKIIIMDVWTYATANLDEPLISKILIDSDQQEQSSLQNPKQK